MRPADSAIFCLAPGTNGELWLGGARELFGRLALAQFTNVARPGARHATSRRGQPCDITTVTQSIVVHRGDVYVAGHEYCEGPGFHDFHANLLERFDGRAFSPLPPPTKAAGRVDLAFHEGRAGRLYATALNAAGDAWSSTLFELASSDWNPLLSLDTEAATLPVEDAQSRLWLVGIGKQGAAEPPTAVLRRDGTVWSREQAPAFGNLVAATDGALFYQGARALWLREGSTWMPRPAPPGNFIIQLLARSAVDAFVLVYPSAVWHFDGKHFERVPIDGVVEGDPPGRMAWNGQHLWLASFRRIWKLASDGEASSPPITAR